MFYSNQLFSISINYFGVILLYGLSGGWVIKFFYLKQAQIMFNETFLIKPYK